jgi:hypothetical protein
MNFVHVSQDESLERMIIIVGINLRSTQDQILLSLNSAHHVERVGNESVIVSSLIRSSTKRIALHGNASLHSMIC